MILTLIFAVLLGMGVAYFAVQNTNLITITLANYPLSSIPLYIVVIGALLLGIVISFVLHLIGSLSSFLALRGKDSTISTAQREIKTLRQENQDLKLENARLRGENRIPERTERVVTTEPERPRYSFLERLRHSF